jgi:hypothetical protein
MDWQTLNDEVQPRFHFALTLQEDIRISIRPLK